MWVGFFHSVVIIVIICVISDIICQVCQHCVTVHCSGEVIRWTPSLKKDAMFVIWAKDWVIAECHVCNSIYKYS